MAGSTVLLVEDNEDNRFIYGAILEQGGYRVLEATTGEEGVRMALALVPDLVIMDVSLPRMDGIEATRLLRSDPRTSGLLIMAVTAHAMEEDRRRALDAGCDAFLVKPVAPSRLLAEVRRLLEQDGGGGASPDAAAPLLT